MSRMVGVVWLALLIGMLPISAVSACINDSETVRTESDFKKHYEFRSGHQQLGEPSQSEEEERSWIPLAAGVVGFGLLASSAALFRSSGRKTQS